jgi:hypothetical protein
LTSQVSQSQNFERWRKLHQAALEEIARQNPNNLVDWTLAHRRIRGRPLDLTPALRDIYADQHPFIVIQKGAQVGITEYMISSATWVADTGQGGRGNSLYLMPTESGMRDFSAARVGRAIDESPYLKRRLREESSARRVTDRAGLKAIGAGHVYFRGSESQRQVASVDADAVYLDEFDIMDPGVLALALQRLGSSQLGLIRIASTPRYPEAGINGLFLQSDQRRYYLPCPRCRTEQTLDWPDNVDIERAMIVCRRPSCRERMELWAEGSWRASAPGNGHYRGYQLSRLYSPLANVEAMIREAEAATIYEEQQFRNQVLGEIYVPEGGGLSISQIDQNRQDYRMEDYAGEETFMGVDVGKKLHVVVRVREGDYRHRSGRVVFAAEVDEFAELGNLITRFKVITCVIDSQPEGHLAKQFACAYSYKVYLAMYNRQQPGHERIPGADDRPNFVHANRTEALDEVTHRMKQGNLPLPKDARVLGGRAKDGIGDYYRQLLAVRRTIETDDSGNLKARWLHGSAPDHYAHAEAYCLLASSVAYVSQRIYAVLPR